MAEDDPLERLDYYKLLQVPHNATRDAVRDAFHRFAAKYHPDKHTGDGASASKVERAAQIYRRGAEAYKVLTDPPRRRAYDQGLSEGRLRYDPNAVPPDEPKAALVWPLKIRNPAARPFATKAEQAYKAGDFATAKVNLKLAASKDPGNVQIGAWLEHVKDKVPSKKPSEP